MTPFIALAIALVAVRQFRARALRPGLIVALPVLLVGLGVQGLDRERPVAAAAVVALALDLAVATALGLLRGRSEHVWRDRDGVAMHHGTLATGALWLVTIGARVAVIAAERALGAGVAVATELELATGASLAAQFAVIAWRAGLFDGPRTTVGAGAA